MYFELKDIDGTEFNIPAGVTTLLVYNCKKFETVPAGVTDLWVYYCPKYKGKP